MSDVASTSVIYTVAHLFNMQSYNLVQAKDAEGLLVGLSKLGNAPK